MLECWEVASARGNVGDLWFHNLGCDSVTFTESWRLISVVIAKWNAWAQVGWRQQWTANGKYASGGGVCQLQNKCTSEWQGYLLHCCNCHTVQLAVTLNTVQNYRNITVLLSAQGVWKCLTMRSTSLLLLMVILASCQCRYEFLYRVYFLCTEGCEEWGRTKGFGIPSPRFLTLLTWH